MTDYRTHAMPKGMTVEQAATIWVDQMYAIPMSVVEKLIDWSGGTDFESLTDDYSLPRYPFMWAFSDATDREWLEDEDNRQKMAECGFSIYKSEDYGYVFGINGEGYNFYIFHFVPLYKARGLKWHDVEE